MVNNKFLIFLLLLLSTGFSALAQLHFEDMVFEKLGRPFLDNASAVTASPDGAFLYVSSYDDGAISVFRRNTDGTLEFINAQINELEGVSGLTNTYDVKVSPDNRHIYATSETDNALVYFSKNPTTGILTYLGKYEDGVNNIEGLEGAFLMDFSPDGNYLYVLGRNENALSVFNRNVNDGSLSPIQILRDDQQGNNNMNYPVTVKVTPDSRHVMVTSYGDEALSWYTRDASTGMLTYSGALLSEDIPNNPLEGAFGLDISKDGKNAYVSSRDGNSLDVFSRNSNTGMLSYMTSFVNEENGITGLLGTAAVVVSADDEQVYAAGTGSDALVVFNRNTVTGSLTYKETLTDGTQNITDLDFPVAFAVNEHFDEIYVADFGSNALLAFSRDENSDALDFSFSERGSGLGITGLKGVVSATLSPDGNHLYAAGKDGDAMSIFNRNTDDGSLDFQEFLEDGGGLDGLNGVTEILFSPDGTDAYVSGFWDNTVTHFERDAATGSLTLIESQKDGLFGVDGISGANSMVMTDNGAYLFVAGFWDNAIGVFARNVNDGTLTFVEAYFDGENGQGGTLGIQKIAMHPSGTHLYALGSEDQAIAQFAIDTEDGTLSYQEMYAVPDAVQMDISPDGNHLYSVNETTNSVSQFLVNNDGSLTFQITYDEGLGGGMFDGLQGVTTVNFNPEGTVVYFSSQTEHTIAAYRRDVNNGDLFFEQVQRNDEDNVHGIQGITNVITSADGKYIYTTSAEDNAVATFSCTYFFEETATICNGESLTIGGRTFSETGHYQEVVENESCIINYDVQLTVQAESYIYDVAICDGAIYILGDQAYNTAGTYSYDFSSASACDSLVTINLSIVDAFDPVSEVVEICVGETYELGDNSYAEAGMYEVTWSTAGGCDSTIMLNLLVNDSDELTMTELLCEQEFYVFGNQNIIESGTYTQVFENQQGCDSMVTLTLDLYPGTSEIEATICAGESYEFDGSLYTTSGTYEGIILSNGGCEIFTTLYLEVFDNFQVEANVIENEGNELGAIILQVAGGASPYIYQWSNGVTISEVHQLNPGTYTVTITDANGCTQILEFPLNLTTKTTDLASFSASTIFPNPSNSSTNFNIKLSTSHNQAIEIRILDIRGQVLMSHQEHITAGTSTLSLPTPKYVGIYLIQIIDQEGNSLTKKLSVI